MADSADKNLSLQEEKQRETVRYSNKHNKILLLTVCLKVNRKLQL